MSTLKETDKPHHSHHILALGSSFAAGPGIFPYKDREAGRSEFNYASILAAKLNAKLTDRTVSGATLLNVLNTPQVAWRGGRVFDPQLEGLEELMKGDGGEVDIVTITAGGNDLGYIGGVSYDVLANSVLGRVVRWFLPTPADAPDVDEVVGRFVDVIDEVKRRAPKARIYLVDYLTLFGRDTKAGIDVGLSEEKVAYWREVGDKLSKVYKNAAERRPETVLVDAGKRSWEHGLGSEEPWVEGLSLKGVLWERKAPFHPNRKGMEAVAEMVFEKTVGMEGIAGSRSSELSG